MQIQYDKYMLLLLTVVIPILLFVSPLFVIGINSLMIDGVLSLDNYIKFFSSQVYIRSLTNSLLIATISTIMIAPIGLFIVAETRKYNLTKKIIKILTSLPLVFPSFIFCVSLIYIYGQTGMLNYILSIIGFPFMTSLYSITGIIFANILFFLPYFIIPLFASFEDLNPLLEEAAESLGSEGFHKFRRIIFPQVLHGFITGVLITFLLIFNQISVIIALGAGRVYTLTYELYSQYEGFEFEMANTIATISIIITFAVAIIFHVILRRLWKK